MKQHLCILLEHLVTGKVHVIRLKDVWKRKIDQCMSSAQKEIYKFMEICYIQNVQDVYLALDNHFGKVGEKDSQ